MSDAGFVQTPERVLLRLNIGSGGRRIAGFLNVDNNGNGPTPDVVHDLDLFPWPFEEGSVREVVMDHCLEHLEDTIGVIQELYRICAHGARLEIRVPHYSCNWTHPGHKRAVGVGLFDHFDPGHSERYGRCHFQVERVRLHWMRPRAQTTWLRKAISRAIDGLANLNVRWTQRIWCYWVGGFDEIEFQARVIKKR
ncbi:MAG: hypothetical protein HYS41_01360 [Candidatus Omnitrophica bacterium]|nr:hypothetical protein [Candidatus Omnitrophota bacterium]